MANSNRNNRIDHTTHEIGIFCKDRYGQTPNPVVAGAVPDTATISPRKSAFVYMTLTGAKAAAPALAFVTVPAFNRFRRRVSLITTREPSGHR
ncbi:hypothetical protein [Streptomyces sp. NBC_00872]|uniref:hypothetical protein n=1 Tax=Streptomyces sp. NBC_00872 TaxID=2903686 RepID=UPI00386B9D7A|nr:hypothetical protein OG214_00115 [Streptomyces sp. NBC_00872]